jgi:hypothetical protein
MTEKPIDLSSLDPTRDRTFAAMTRGVAHDAMSARRRALADPISDVAQWTGPALAAAVVIAAAATLALVSVGTPEVATRPDQPTEIAGIPPLIIEWAHTNHRPSPLELVGVLGQRPQRQ